MLQSLLKFTHVSCACTPLIIFASENKGKLVSPICMKIMFISSHSCISFKAACFNHPFHENELENHWFLNGRCHMSELLVYRPQSPDIKETWLSSASSAVQWRTEEHRFLFFNLKILKILKIFNLKIQNLKFCYLISFPLCTLTSRAKWNQSWTRVFSHIFITSFHQRDLCLPIRRLWLVWIFTLECNKWQIWCWISDILILHRCTSAVFCDFIPASDIRLMKLTQNWKTNLKENK